eukprot:scaffold5869_cov165-Amphora_coffeaeformis.AAC.8
MKYSSLLALSLSLAGICCHAFQQTQGRRVGRVNGQQQRLATPPFAAAAVLGKQQLQPVSFQKDTSLWATSSEPASNTQKLDVEALGKYALALGTQMGLFYAIFQRADYVLGATGIQVPFAVNCVLFWFLALRSRILNPLENSRPKTDNLETGTERRNMPSWTPPGFIFPIMWILIIGPIRAATTAMVYDVTGSYATTAILSLMLHLSIGDVWNTINNVERRYGASVVGVLLVWLSNAHAAYQYYQVSHIAGQLLCLPLIWLSVASALIIRTWQLNPDDETELLYPLYPVVGQGKTEFKWFK